MNAISRSDIPHGLRLLIEAAGEEAAVAIALRQGGARLRIPKKAEGSMLAEWVGIDAARAIVDSLADERIEIPLAKRHLNASLRAGGWSQERRAVALKVTRRTIQHWDAGSAQSRQIDFFER